MSAWVKGSNRASMRSAAIPTPVSPTTMRSHTSSRSMRSTATVTSTSPTLVNFTALDSRLTRICRSRAGSPITTAGTSGATS